MFVFLQVVVALAVLWAVVGAILYAFLSDSLGWGRFSPELQWTLFLGLSLALAGITAALGLVVLQVTAWIRRRVLRR